MEIAPRTELVITQLRRLARTTLPSMDLGGAKLGVLEQSMVDELSLLYNAGLSVVGALINSSGVY